MGPEHFIITHLIKFCLAYVSDEIFSVFDGFDIGIPIFTGYKTSWFHFLMGNHILFFEAK